MIDETLIMYRLDKRWLICNKIVYMCACGNLLCEQSLNRNGACVFKVRTHGGGRSLVVALQHAVNNAHMLLNGLRDSVMILLATDNAQTMILIVDIIQHTDEITVITAFGDDGMNVLINIKGRDVFAIDDCG